MSDATRMLLAAPSHHGLDNAVLGEAIDTPRPPPRPAPRAPTPASTSTTSAASASSLASPTPTCATSPPACCPARPVGTCRSSTPWSTPPPRRARRAPPTASSTPTSPSTAPSAPRTAAGPSGPASSCSPRIAAPEGRHRLTRYRPEAMAVAARASGHRADRPPVRPSPAHPGLGPRATAVASPSPAGSCVANAVAGLLVVDVPHDLRGRRGRRSNWAGTIVGNAVVYVAS